MNYSKKLLEHFDNPQNMGSMDKNDITVGTAVVGAPACGDVLKLQLKINDDGIIEDAKFKTFGCLAGNVTIATPKGYTEIKDLSVGDIVYAWNGKNTVENKIAETHVKWKHYKELIRFKFAGSSRFNFICSNDHVWWLASNKPVEAIDLMVGDELVQITENELRSLNNIGRTDYMKKLASKTMTKTNQSGKIDRTKMPQHQKGFICKDPILRSKRTSESAKANWANQNYIENWQKGMAGASSVRPTSLEKRFIDLFEQNRLDVRYVGDSQFWCATKGTKAGINPDFKVNGQRKVIEVYDSNMPKFMMDRSDPKWILNRRQQFYNAGFESLFIDIHEINASVQRVQTFIHYGIKVIEKKNVTDKRMLRGLDRDGDLVKLYDIRLEEGANVFFAGRVGTHNCGSAIASSSLVTTLIKGLSMADAEKILNTDIAKELSLPPVKIHCSVLAEDAIKEAIADYRNKQIKSGDNA